MTSNNGNLYFIDQNITACDQLNDPLHGFVSTPDGIVFEAKATYSCESGFELEGEATATCQADGTWSSPPPACLRICKHSYSTVRRLSFRNYFIISVVKVFDMCRMCCRSIRLITVFNLDKACVFKITRMIFFLKYMFT